MMYTVTLGGHQYQVSIAHDGREAFWQKLGDGGWEDETLRFVATHVDADTVFFDIGAWIGPISLAAAARARSVVALEPDPIAFAELKENVTSNGLQIEALNAAISTRAGPLTLFAKTGLGDSMTSALDGAGDGIDVDTVSFADLTARLPKGARAVVKVDIEGYEYRIGDALIDFVVGHRAPLHLSVHPAIMLAAERSNFVSARFATYRATRTLLSRLAEHGTVTHDRTGAVLTDRQLFKTIALHRIPKNFSVVFVPG